MLAQRFNTIVDIELKGTFANSWNLWTQIRTDKTSLDLGIFACT